jgi:hypothetical protein
VTCTSHTRHNINTIKKNKKALIEASNEIGLEENAEARKYILISRYQVHKMKIGKRSFENMAVKIFGNFCNKPKFEEYYLLGYNAV